MPVPCRGPCGRTIPRPVLHRAAGYARGDIERTVFNLREAANTPLPRRRSGRSSAIPLSIPSRNHLELDKAHSDYPVHDNIERILMSEQKERSKVPGAGIFSLILVLGVARFSYTPAAAHATAGRTRRRRSRLVCSDQLCRIPERRADRLADQRSRSATASIASAWWWRFSAPR